MCDKCMPDSLLCHSCAKAASTIQPSRHMFAVYLQDLISEKEQAQFVIASQARIHKVQSESQASGSRQKRACKAGLLANVELLHARQLGR